MLVIYQLRALVLVHTVQPPMRDNQVSYVRQLCQIEALC
jgi:hypothetical protein